MEKPIIDPRKVEAQIANLMAETAKFVAESEKYRREAGWLPVISSAAFIGSVIGVSKWVL